MYKQATGEGIWTIAQWKKVTWSDESCFHLHHVDSWVLVHHLSREEMAPECTMERRQADGGSVMGVVSKFPRSQSDRTFVGCAEQTSLNKSDPWGPHLTTSKT